MYTIADHGAFISDKIRTDAYVQALSRAVKPGCTVMDIGTGVGIFALLACKFGARKVYAVETGDVIQLARENAAANGYTDRIEFLQELSTKIQIPERVDVIVSDLRGVLPFFHRHIPSVIDARKRFLDIEGIMIPQGDSLWAALVEAPELYAENISVWENQLYGLSLPAGRARETNTFWKTRLAPNQLITEAKLWSRLDYRTTETPDVSAKLEWVIQKKGDAFGILIWFDTKLANGIGFSNAPGVTRMVYGSAFFPFVSPVAVECGDTAKVAFSGKLIGGDYIWRWQTTVFQNGDPQSTKADFIQSDFFAQSLSLAQLRNRAASYIPEPSRDLQAHQLILSLIDGATSLEEISRKMSTRFPERFPTWQDSLAIVGEVSSKVSK